MMRLLLLLLPVLAFTGCTFNVKESNIVLGRAVPIPDIALVRDANPGYRVEETRIRTGDGEDLQLLVVSGRDHTNAADSPEFKAAVAVLLERIAPDPVSALISL